MAYSSSVPRARLWQQRLAKFDASRLTVADFCRREGISPPSFYLWRKRLSPAAVGRRQAEPPAGFRPVRVMPVTGISVQLPGGTQLVVPAADPESLRVVIETVARVDASMTGGNRTC
jgi:hypothetical protein